MSGAAAIPGKKRKPLLSRIPTGFVQAVLKGHSGLGIAFAAVIYIVCLSGTLAVFYDEFLRWENPDAPRVEAVSPEAVQTALEQAVQQAGEGVEHVYLTMPDKDRPYLRVSVDAAQESDWIADGAGDLVAPMRDAWSEFILGLHIYLHLPATWGIFVVGMTGVALLSSLISGILAHPRILRDAFHLRIGGSQRLQEADLHNRIGVWGLPFHIVISLTGAFLGLVTVTVGVLGLVMFDGDTDRIYDLFLAQEPAENPAPAPLLDLAPMFAQLPDAGRIDRITLEHPTEQGGAALFDFRNDAALAETASYAFDRGGLYYAKGAEDFTFGETVLGSMGPLHFGWFSGGVIKIAYGILGLGVTYLAVGGIKIWLARRRDKGRPAPGWERVWAAVVWGQPLGLAAAALAALAAPAAGQGLLIGVWGGVALAALALAAALPAAAIGRWGKMLSGAALIVLGLWHAAGHGGLAGPALVWIVDLALLAAGALLCGLALGGMRSARQRTVAPQGHP